MTENCITEELREQVRAARVAALKMANLETLKKNEILHSMANSIRHRQAEIITANADDLVEARKMMEQGKLTESMFRRVELNSRKVEQMALNCESVAALPDPVGVVHEGTRLDEGLDLYRISCPIGLILVIFESRPDVVVQISALAIKSGNAVILKGGKEASHSNRMLAQILRDSAAAFDGFPVESVSLIETRDEVAELVRMSEQLDLIIPRGSNRLVQSIQAQAQVPVLGHADGICHVYLHEDADPEKASEVVLDAKTEYPAVCNAMETLLVHQHCPNHLLAEILIQLQDCGVELRVCVQTRERLSSSDIPGLNEADESDWATEYTGLILSVKTVESVETAIRHINLYGSKHTDTIVTENRYVAESFLNEVDAAGVFWNASTRFADGFRYGLGAEVGVSTCKTHARGPVGLEGLVIYKYKLYGSGQGVGRYGQGKRSYLHQPLSI